ncbi:MAG: hypothetical protein KAQ68_05710 [Clostridiales bacterium]|nr:hypothetical protein [Clostridiales bacterium]
MKKTLMILIIAILCAFVILPQSIAYADYDYFEVTYSVNPTSVPEGGGLVDLTVKIEHYSNSAYVMGSAEVLLNDLQIINFRDIYAGQTVTKTGTMQIDSTQVGKDVELTLKWIVDGTTIKTQSLVVTFSESMAEPEVEFSRVVVPLSGEPNTESKITYTVNNVGTLHVTNVEITDPLSGAVDYKELVKSGENFVSTYTRKIGSGYSSKPMLSYKVGDKSYSVELDAIEVTSGEPAISLVVETNKDVIAKGEELTIICTVENTGTADFTTIIVTEKDLGDMFTIDGLKAGESQVFTSNLTIEDSTVLEFTAAGDNGTEQEWVDEKSVSITVDKDSQPLLVDINASPSALQIPIPGMIDFDIIVNNRSVEPLLGLKIVDQDGEIVTEIESLPVGQSAYQWSVNVQQTKIFTFTLEVIQDDESIRTVNSGPIEIKVEESPQVTDASGVSSTDAPIIGDEDVKGLKQVASSLGFIIAMVVLAVIILGILVSRARRRR